MPCRSALLGVIGAVGGEILTGQSVLSQIAGRWALGAAHVYEGCLCEVGLSSRVPSGSPECA